MSDYLYVAGIVLWIVGMALSFSRRKKRNDWIMPPAFTAMAASFVIKHQQIAAVVMTAFAALFTYESVERILRRRTQRKKLRELGRDGNPDK